MQTTRMANAFSSKQVLEGFLPIRSTSLCVGAVAAFDLYVHTWPDQPPVLYLAKGLAFSAQNKQRLKEGAIPFLYVKSTDSSQYDRYVEDNLGSILSDTNTPIKERVEVLYGSAMQVVKDTLEDPRSGEMIPRSRKMVENSVDFLFREPAAFQNLLRVTSHDYYTFTHSVNVFVFSVSLARRMGYSDDTVQHFGCGTLLHDVGKCQVDPEIINCPGRLSAEQFEQVKQHTVYGYEILKEQGVTDEVELDIVRHHHEKLSGKGYPDGLRNGQISPFVRISTAVDIFDALTTRRSYKEAMKSFDALALMKREMSEDLDADVFRLLVTMMSKGGVK